MNKILKMMALSKKSINLENDIELINKYSLKQLTPEDVFAFPVNLCDNEVDRDNEKFDKTGLDELAQLFIGKTGIFNHSWNAIDQIARLYKAEVERTGEKTSLGEDGLVLRGYAYVLRNEFTQETIAKIEGGILKEVSIGFAVKNCICSICGEPFGWAGCKNDHRKGNVYEGEMCYGILKDPTDAYEFSFVAVPTQRGAGVTKSFNGNVEKAFDILLGADLAEYAETMERLEKQYQESLLSVEERDKRQELLVENEKYLKGDK